ncbi:MULTISPECIES: ATP-binding cassette domain-containing protein [unclassified Cryobacterium]|uniref:ATP-binding cassette domain-containing protein n=1 Tax=unclassified Cryobacterium TaxID=2649013 RepID=UPI002AB4465E|nr:MULTISPECIES: ATP-binding cassette domain-containing protein [unclassified Cryobacterium]MDY7544011.1 ATP-binding cassette domain-containing protein [Cryobacterium sp. 5B3]MEA9997867.1 ATP-binding cassette domain-containing protein [Cryobacterium sp. RTS3]MEB0265847.1 ATP-binding cassette domain-containing protein [Cryobacterium sp. 10I5]MEB0273198.1 ATP-binding cassette domain-containing protein [Cryobacterium sp. 5B3]
MFRFRPAPLRAAMLLALGFIGLRVGYRLLFGGGGGGGAVLLDLPRIPLAGPFSHVALFGTVTTGGIWNAALSALPVAAVIAFFGVLNAVVDVSRLFARGARRGPLRTVSRALVIAWATFPALLDSVRRVRLAAALRGERTVAALLVPVFEQTIERALSLAASMETRGFASTRAVDGACEVPALMTDAALDFDGDWRLQHLDLALAPGTLTVIVGPTGSGKSGLLQAMSGLFQHFHNGHQAGRIEIGGADRAETPPRDTAGFVGLVPQNVRLSFVAETVAEEIGFALALRGVAPVIVEQRVREVAAQLGITQLLARPVSALSAGEATLVSLGGALIRRPMLLLIDEPLAELDRVARDRVCGVLDRLAHEAGVCVVVAEHNTREFDPIADAWLVLEGHRARMLLPGELPPGRVGDHRLATPGAGYGPPTEVPADEVPANAGPLAGIHGLTVRHGDRTVVDAVSLELAAGEIVALEGRNGAGKSSLLNALALPSTRGTVIVAGQDVAALPRKTRRRAVALVPENFDDLFFATTVADECRRSDRSTADRRTGRMAGRRGGRSAISDPGSTAGTFARLLGHDSATAAPLLERHPRDLSAGQRLCLAIAIQLAAAPRVLLVDEPTRGLDAAARALVGAALQRASNRECAVLFATHDRDFARHFATRALHLEAGRVTGAEYGGAETGVESSTGPRSMTRTTTGTKTGTTTGAAPAAGTLGAVCTTGPDPRVTH